MSKININQLEYNDNGQLIYNKKTQMKKKKNNSFSLGQKVSPKEPIVTHEGTIYENQILKIKDLNGDDVKVEDPMGKKYWITTKQLKTV
jgi:hypothetical protein